MGERFLENFEFVAFFVVFVLFRRGWYGGGIDTLCPYRQPCFLLKEITRNYLENNGNDIEDDSPALSEKGW